jgi:hypothetical protein
MTTAAIADAVNAVSALALACANIIGQDAFWTGRSLFFISRVIGEAIDEWPEITD